MPLDHWVKGLWSPLARLGSELGSQEEDEDGKENGREDEKMGARVVPGGASLTKMEEATTAYLKREFDPNFDTYAPPKTMLDQSAEKMVRLRRARAQLGGERWDTFIGKYLTKKRGETGAEEVE